MSNNKRVDVIGIQMDLGASKRGVNMGPAALRYADLAAKMRRLGIDVRDKGDIIPLPDGESLPGLNNCGQIVEANGRLFAEVLESAGEGRIPVVLGGDHVVAAGSIQAVAKARGRIGLIWVDAHGDFNDEKSSPTGNMHGMPFSAVCGLGPKALEISGGGFVSPANAVQIGGRDIDDLERLRLKDSGVTVFSMSEIDRIGIGEVMRRAIKIASDGTAGIHVSYDIDAVTPEEAPGVGTPVHSGLTVRESFLIAEMLSESGGVISIDMVEVNPILDDHNKTGELACELILSLLGKTVY
jgi:arginase